MWTLNVLWSSVAIMGTDSHRSRDGGSHFGGFFQLFDRNAKSQKKLLPSNSNLPEQLRQKMKSDGNCPAEWFHLMDDKETEIRPNFKGSNDYSFASSVTDEEGCGTGVPGVVARLMGLDSLPTSNFVEPYSSPYINSQFLRDAHLHVKNIEFRHDNQEMHSGSLHNKVKASRVIAREVKPYKMINRPIEKFQTENVPPKLAKSLPVTHYKLLSPTKSPSLIASKNATHIMKATANVVELETQTTIKAKMLSSGSSSVPLRVRDLKEKMEATQKPSRRVQTSQRPDESNAAKYLREKAMDKSWNGPVDVASSKIFSDSKECCNGLKNDGKAMPLALRAKVNLPKREGLNPKGTRSSFFQKEPSDTTSGRSFENQRNIQKLTHKKPCKHSTTCVLMQNNQKQNCLMDRGKLPTKPLISNSQGRKGLSGDSILGRDKSLTQFAGNCTVGCRKSGIQAVSNNSNKKRDLYAGKKNICQKKPLIDRNFEKNQCVNDMVVVKNRNPIDPTSVIDQPFSGNEDGKRKGMDVVSFTFTAPMARSVPDSKTSRQAARTNSGFITDYQSKMILPSPDIACRLSSLAYNQIENDTLSILLEQKLSKSSHGVDLSSCKGGASASSATIFQNLVVEEINESTIESENQLDCWHPSPISVLKPSFSNGTCYSSDSTDRNRIDGGKHSSGWEALSRNSSRKFHFDVDTELSDSDSSTSTRNLARTHLTTSPVDLVRSARWEMEYVTEILCNVESMFKDFALGSAVEIISPCLYLSLLESQKGVLGMHGDEPKLGLKVLFDCVGECIDLRCRRYAGGGCRTWAKGLSMVRKKEWLAREVYQEILGWRGMRDCMVDELVDKNMSSKFGGWLQFEVEAFEFGIEIETWILDSLIDEVVSDALLF